MNKHIAPVLAAVAMLGVVGGVAATQALKPVESAKPQVQLVQPAAETVTPEPTVTATVTVAPKPAPAPVASTTSAPAPKKTTTIQRQVTVSEPTPEPTTSTPKYGTNPKNGAPNPPPVDRGTNDLPPTSN